MKTALAADTFGAPVAPATLGHAKVDDGDDGFGVALHDTDEHGETGGDDDEDGEHD